MRWLVLLLLLGSCGHAAYAQHPTQDLQIHERFYRTWLMPDKPFQSCCSDHDCYPTEVRYRDGNTYARRREDGRWMLIPPQKIEQKRDNPDGRNHLCAPPPSPMNNDAVYCFIAGSGT